MFYLTRDPTNQLRNYESWFFSSKFVFIWSNFFYLWKNKLQLDQILSVFWALIVYFLLKLRVLIYFISWSWIFSLTFVLKICFDQANNTSNKFCGSSRFIVPELVDGYQEQYNCSLYFEELSTTYNGMSLVWTRNLSDDFYSICNFWLKLPKLKITLAFEIGSVFPLIIVNIVGITLTKNFQWLAKMLTHVLT